MVKVLLSFEEPRFSSAPFETEMEEYRPSVIVCPLPRRVVGHDELKETPLDSKLSVSSIMYSPLFAPFTVATALSNSLLLLTSIVVGVAANADIGITNA